MKIEALRHLGPRILSISAITIILGFPLSASAAPITIRSVAGADAAAIQGVVDLFRADLGGVNNGNTAGSLATGRREVNWDGGGAAANATLFTSPMNTFNSGGTTRGLVSTDRAAAGFEISGQPTPEFGDINATYPAIFQTFSAPRLFAPLGTNVMDALFFEPGTNNQATVSGFGAVFTDVDLANTSSLEFFTLTNVSLGTFFVPTANNGLSFLGVTFTDRIARVRITDRKHGVGPERRRRHGRGRPRRFHLRRTSAGSRASDAHIAWRGRRGRTRGARSAAPRPRS